MIMQMKLLESVSAVGESIWARSASRQLLGTSAKSSPKGALENLQSSLKVRDLKISMLSNVGELQEMGILKREWKENG